MNKSKIRTIVLWSCAVCVAAMLLFGGAYTGIKSGFNDFINPPATEVPAE